MKRINRRKFLLTSSSAVVALSLQGCGKPSNGGNNDNPLPPQAKSRVAQCTRPQWFPPGEKPDPETVAQLLHLTLQTLFQASDPRDALRGIFSPKDTVALKVNCLSGSSMSTHPQLAWAMVDLLKKIGVKEDRIIIWDRKDADLPRAGFQLNHGNGVKVYGTDSSGYSPELVSHRSIGSFFARILDDATKIICLPVLKDHGIVGVTLSLKNFFGAIHNPNKYHPNGGDPYVADLFSYPPIRDKMKLTVVDGILGQYEGGPPPQPQWQWNFGGLITGTDPVAVDRIGLNLIEDIRARNGIPSLSQASRYPNYLITAEKLGLGNFQRDKIELVEG